MIKEKYIKLVDAYKDEDTIDIIQSDIVAICLYFSAVCNMEVKMPVLRRTCEGEYLRDITTHLDEKRHDAHERAIAAIKRLNRYAQKKDLEPIFEGDADDRLQVAEFCKAVVDEFFDNRTM